MKSLISLLTVLILCFFVIPLKAQDIEVTLLGTGSPIPSMDRFGAATLIEAGDNTILVDVGRGVNLRLSQTNVSYDSLDAIFLTHLHSDHIVGLPDLWLTGWIQSNRDRPLTIFGPVGTSELIDNLSKAFAFDIYTRSTFEGQSVIGSILQVVEVDEGYIYENNGIKVIPFTVDHNTVKPALGYRIEFNNRKIVISGDTRYSENVIENSRGADLLIHEVIATAPALKDRLRSVINHHTTPQQAGQIFNLTKPKLAVYSHLILAGVSADVIESETRETYDGPLVVGQDLMKFIISDGVEVLNP